MMDVGMYETYVSEVDDAYDFCDIDCEDCGVKFFVRPSRYDKQHPMPTRCGKCRVAYRAFLAEGGAPCPKA